jgi:polysaccharide pyruvyl transferase WcaK-like protein
MEELRIGLLNHAFGRPNLGVDALSRSNIAIIRSVCAAQGIQPRFTLFGKPGSIEPEVPDIVAGRHLRIRELPFGGFRRFRSELADCDLIVDICAGDGFSDIYGAYLFMAHNIGKWAGIYSGRPFVLAPQTIGPFKSRWSGAVARNIFKNATLTFARDSMSREVLAQLGVESPFREVTDVAFRLPFSAGPLRSETKPVRVGINVSGLLFNHGDRFDLSINYRELTSCMIESVLSRTNHEVWLVAHVIHDDESDEDDFEVCRSLSTMFPRVKLAPKFQTSIEAKSFIAQLDFFTGGRMHACIGAISAGVPVAPIAYSRKFNGLFGTLGYDHVIDGRKLKTEDALSKFETLLDMRIPLIDECRLALDNANGRLKQYEESLAALIHKIPHSEFSSDGI